MRDAPTIPETAVPWRISIAGLSGFTLGFYLAYLLRALPAVALLALFASTGLPMWILEWRRRQRLRPASEVRAPTGPFRSWRLRGLLIALPVWALTLNVLPLAGNSGGTVSGFWTALSAYWPLLLLGMAWYVLRPARAAASGLELAGRWWAGHEPGEKFPWHVLRDQLVKAFFLPLMITFSFNWAVQASQAHPTSGATWIAAGIAVLYLIDTTFGTIGYLSTSKAVDAHIRSSNPYWLGWASALICYPPFFIWLQQTGFNYRDGYAWNHWLEANPAATYAWGGAILLLSGIYALSTVVFGIRFSNLTHRGILTHGPYRWTKHPAYLSKNLSWWLISIPFIPHLGTKVAVAQCGMLACMNVIYWVRAKTEERHLMHDPDYRAYADWIAQHGLFAKLAHPFRRRNA